MRPRLLAAASLALVPALLASTTAGFPAATSAATPAAASADVVDHRTVFTFADPDINESSGLVARGGVMFTVNDSGDGPYLYVVDAASGETIGVTTYSSGDVSDVEALAPGTAGTVWVGDIGDNNEDRPGVDVYKVPAERPRGEREADAQRFALAYPDRPHNAEALLAHPASGRLYVVTKGLLGGTVFAAPARLGPTDVNVMSEVGRVPGVVTDGAFSADGRHILLRTYGTAAFYTFPGLRPVGSMELPEQEQGEAVAVNDRGAVFLSSEGEHTEVLQISLPERIRAALVAEDPAPAPAPAAEPAHAEAPDAAGVWVAAGILLLTLVAWLLLRGSRRRSPRRR